MVNRGIGEKSPFPRFSDSTFENERDFPRTKLMGVRWDLVPATWLELGAARTVMFGGRGRPEPSGNQWPAFLMQSSDRNTSRFSGNSLLQGDATVRLADLRKYLPLVWDAELYLDVGVDDTCCGTAFIPLKPGATAGLYLPNLFQSPDTTFRIEYSNTSSLNFTHGTYVDGYIRKGQVLSYFEGMSGEDLFHRLTQRLEERLLVGVELDLARRGSTKAGTPLGTKELHRRVGVDVSYRPMKQLTMNLGARLEWVGNRDFVRGDNDINQVYTLELTYAFDTLVGRRQETVGRRQGGS